MINSIALRRDSRPFMIGILAAVAAIVATIVGTGAWASADGGTTGTGTTGTLPPPAADTLPGAPTHVVAMAGDGEAGVAWSEPVHNGGSHITGYVIDVEPGDDTTAPADDHLTAVVSGLDNGTTYRLRVAAVNEHGQGPWSRYSNRVTPEAGKKLNIDRLENRQHALRVLVARLRAKYEELQELARHRLEEARERAEEQLDKAREHAEEQIDRAEKRTDEAIDRLHEKADEALDRVDDPEKREALEDRIHDAEEKVNDRLDDAREKTEERLNKTEEKVNERIEKAEERTRTRLEAIAERLRELANKVRGDHGDDSADDDVDEHDSEGDTEDDSDESSDDDPNETSEDD